MTFLGNVTNVFSSSLTALSQYSDCCCIAHRRANCIRKLFIQDELVIGSLPAAVMTAVLGSQCSSLEGLYLHAADVSLAGQDIAVLAVLTRLSMLQVHDTCFNPTRLHEFPNVCIASPMLRRLTHITYACQCIAAANVMQTLSTSRWI